MTTYRSHPIPTGTAVLVHHIPLARRPTIEGRALILGQISAEPHVYRVRFEGERIEQVRGILGGLFQSHSALCIAELQAQWLASFRHAQHLDALLRSDEGRRG